VDFSDRICGPKSLDLKLHGGDFVIWKKDNEPAYQLAVVVDDAEQKINSVVRGDDLLSSAARQILIYQALGFPVPEFAHVPLVVGTDGRRLAKRHGDTTIRQFREQGVSSAQMLRMLAATFTGAISVPPDSIHQASDLLPEFQLEAVGHKPVLWDGKEMLI
jgi:glutamyl-tRNA synthetase